MIEYDKETRTIERNEWIDWETHVRPVYQDVIKGYDPQFFQTTPADLLSRKQTENIMEYVRERALCMEASDERQGCPLTPLYDAIRPAVEDWCEDWVVEVV